MSVDFESVKDKAVVLAQSGVNKAKELTNTGITKARGLADTGAAKAKEVSEIGKLKVQNSTEQEAIRKAYSDLGKLYMESKGRPRFLIREVLGGENPPGSDEIVKHL